MKHSDDHRHDNFCRILSLKLPAHGIIVADLTAIPIQQYCKLLNERNVIREINNLNIHSVQHCPSDELKVTLHQTAESDSCGIKNEAIKRHLITLSPQLKIPNGIEVSTVLCRKQLQQHKNCSFIYSF